MVALLPVWVIGFFTYNTSNRIITDEFHRSTSETLREIDRGIDNYFVGLEGYLNMLSGNINFKEIELSAERESFALDSLSSVAANRKDITSIYMGRPNKKITIYPAANLAADFDPTTRSWYKGAVDKKGGISYTDPYKDTITGKPMVSISKVVENKGEFVGVISIDVNLDEFSKALSNITIASKGYVFISSSEGIMIAHPDASLLGGKTTTELSYWENAKKQESGHQTFLYKGENNFINYTTNKKTGWKLMASLPVTELNNHTDVILNTTLISAVIVGIIAILIAILVSSQIASKLNKLISIFKKAAEGDLTVEVQMNSKDEFQEVGNHFNMMIRNIGELISNVKTSSDVIYKTSDAISSMVNETNNAVNEVALTIDQVARGASETSQDIQTGVDTVDVLAGQIDNIGALAREMIAVSEKSNDLGIKGLDAVNKLTETSERNNKASLEIGQVISDMDNTTGEIGMITDTINNIASQTNLLALNAAIEAARAGEAGRGFSVVAEEIRKLADQSTSATKRIQALIDTIKNKSQAAVKSVEETKFIVAEENQSVADTKNIFNKILESIGEIVKEIKLIQVSIEETNKGKQEIVSRMQNISAVAEESSASAEEVSATTQEVDAAMNEFTNSAAELQELSKKLEEQINKFKL